MSEKERGQVHVVSGDEQGLRFDVFVSEKDPALTRSQARRLIDDGCILVNGSAEKAGYRLRAGDAVSVRKPAPVPSTVLPEDIPIEILYEDEDIVVVNKPAGMVVHPAAGNFGGTLVNALQFHCRNLSGIGGVLRPGIVHRLDKDTSGLMVIAKTDRAHAALSGQFKDREVEKVYTVLVYGSPRQDEGVVDAAVGRHPTERKKMSVHSRRGKPAITRWKVLERFGALSLIEAKIETGRTHQIRVHLNAIGHPVVGDPVYGGAKRTLTNPRQQAIVKRVRRQALHAGRLCFRHPVSNEPMQFESPLPPDMADTLDALRG